MKKLLTVIGFLLLAQWADAANRYWVRPTGTMSGCTPSATAPATDSGYKSTVAAGIGCLASGDTLTLRTGTYAEGIDMSTMTALSGTSYSNATTIEAYLTEIATVRGLGTGGLSPGQTLRYFIFKGDSTAKNFVFDCTSNGSASCMNVVGNSGTVDHIKFDGVDIKNLPNLANSGAIFNIGSNAGVGSDIWVTSSKVHDMFGCGNSGAENNVDSHGFYIETSNNLIENTEIYNIAGFGIHEYNENPTPLMTGNIYRNNYIHDTGLNTSSVGTFTQCRQSTMWGIMASRSSGTQIYNNRVIHNLNGITVGALGTSASNAKVYSNTLYKNGTSPFDANPVCCYEAIQNSGANNNIRNNIVFGNAADQITDIGTGSVVSPNLVATNPLFVNAAGNDFHLQSGSPAINVGDLLGSPFDHDAEGNTRPQPGHAKYTDGAYEFVTGVTPFTVSINSTNPASGASITISPTDNGGNNNCTTPCTRTWNSGTNITLTAAANAGGNSFGNWTAAGCSSTAGAVCSINSIAADLTETANYQTPGNPDRTLTVASNPSSVTIADTTSFLKITPFTRVVPDGTALVIKANAKADCAMARWLLTEGSGTSISDQCNGNTLTLSNTSWSGSDLVFNGTSSIGTAADSDFFRSASQLSVAATVTPGATLTDFAAAVAKNYRWVLYAGSPGSYCGGPVGVLETTTGEVSVCSATPLTNGVTYKLAFVISPTDLKLYKDGSLLATTANTSSAFSLTDSTFTVTVGATQYGEFLNGKIRDVRIAGRSWSGSDVTTYGAGTLNEGASFTSWQGGCNTASGVTCNATMSQDKTITAIYTPIAPTGFSAIFGN